MSRKCTFSAEMFDLQTCGQEEETLQPSVTQCQAHQHRFVSVYAQDHRRGKHRHHLMYVQSCAERFKKSQYTVI